MKNALKAGVGFIAALVVGAGVGAAVANAARPDAGESASTSGQRASGDHRPARQAPLQRNASGLTFGASGLGDSPSDDPSLVLVVATNGKTGYAYSRELNGQQPSSPAEAAELPRSWTVPVYLSDGKTKIGEFVVG